MGFTETTLLIIALVLMLLGVIASLIPFLPGPVIVWAVGLIFALLTGFEQVTYLAVAAMTLLMIAGATSDIWMQAFGVQMEGGSCLSTIGSLVGGLAGSLLIPIPILGTIIGLVAGALLFELLHRGQVQPALQAGRNAFQLYLLSVAAEFVSSVMILLVFVFSVWLYAK